MICKHLLNHLERNNILKNLNHGEPSTQYAGVDGSLWLTTAYLYRDAETSIKWSSHVSEPFKVQQGVRLVGGGEVYCLHSIKNMQQRLTPYDC